MIDMNSFQSIYHIFAAQVDARPNAIAVRCAGQTLSYQDLARRSAQLAQRLRQSGITSNQLVGLCVEQSIDIVVGMLGILQAGGVVVPLDPAYPQKRLQSMVADAKLSLIVTQAPLAEVVHTLDITFFILETDESLTTPTLPEECEQPDSLAFCLHTSGSTGKPKGVLIQHHALINHCAHLSAFYKLTPADNVLQFAPYYHIAGLEPILVALLSGATVILREPELWTAEEFPSKVEEYQLTIVDLPTSYCQILLEQWGQSLVEVKHTLPRIMIIGGEAAPLKLLKLWQQLKPSSVRLLNVYGMTEAVGTVTIYEIPNHVSDSLARIPIGRPLAGRDVHILDEDLRPVQEMEVGELYVGGKNLAKAYLHQPTLTESRFLPAPLATVDGDRIYRTGDMVRWALDTTGQPVIEYMGRSDQQVQIRGFRVELHEIEAVLQQHPSIQQVAVVAKGEGTAQRLIAYVSSTIHSADVPPKSSTKNPLAFWEPDQAYQDEQGLLIDPLERMNFKLAQHNLRIAETRHKRVSLEKPVMDDDFLRPYLTRQSYRRFANRSISMKQFSGFLTTLLQVRLPDVPLPKYRYPSALGLYPVQTYLYVKPDQVEGVDAGFYYYHPVEHELQLIQNSNLLDSGVYAHFDRPTYEQANIAIFLVAHMNAIVPIYGERLAREFCLLEAGYLGQMLMAEAPQFELGLCPIGLFEDETVLETAFQFATTQKIIHSFLAGPIENAQTRAWLQPESTNTTSRTKESELRDLLHQNLPEHMIPDTIVIQDKLPMTPSGKIDRPALMALPIDNVSDEYQAPSTQTEEALQHIWQELLNLSQVSVTDEFFGLGGNSLLALQLLSQLEAQLNVVLPLQTLLTHNTIQQLAQKVESCPTYVVPSISTTVDEEYEEGIL